MFYLFLIRLHSEETLKLTSANHPFDSNLATGEMLTFLPNSNLSVKEIVEDISGKGGVVVEGVRQDGGVSDPALLAGCQIRIFKLISQKMHRVGTYACLGIETCGISFRLHLESKYYLTQKTLAENYSRSCRAVFGDKRCGFNVKQLEFELEVEKVHIDKISLRVPKSAQPKAGVYPLKSGYYDNGFIKVGPIMLTIAKHFAGANGCIDVYLSCVLHDSARSAFVSDSGDLMRVVLTPNCDKTLTQCHEVYRNAVNFRGESFLV